MYIKRLKRKCGVRGCKNTDSYAISVTREIGNGVIICKNCLEDAIKSIEEYNPMVVTQKKELPTPTLFFNAEALGAIATVVVEEEKVEVTPDTEENDENSSAELFKCPKCGKEFKTEKGLKAHLSTCKAESSAE